MDQRLHQTTRAGRQAPVRLPGLDTGSDADRLNDGDLLAPTLLNAPPSVSAFYQFQKMKDPLQQALADHPDAPLVDLDDSTVSAKLHALYSVLDENRKRSGPRGQSGTTLSKILHRKHPESLPLHDRWVRLCYLGTKDVPRARSRSWAAYMGLVAHAMRDDIARQATEFTQLRNATQGPLPLTDLRLLDILAWSSKGVTTQSGDHSDSQDSTL